MGSKSANLRRVLQSTAAFCAAFGGVAYAQETTHTDDATIVVHGYRASVQSAIDTKRSATGIIDVIRADDIASFPDANLAESIQRIPGVSIERDSGEGRSISVRGLGGDFVRTLLNGVEAYSATTGSTLGSALINRTRGFDYSTFASELFNSVTVRKSQSSELDEGSLSATVELNTARPFDFDGFHAAASLQGAYYDAGGPVQPRIAGLISNTWGDFGALVSFAYNKRLAIEDGYSDTSQSDYSDLNNGFCGTAADIPSQPGDQTVNSSTNPFVNPLVGTGNRPGAQCFSGIPSNTAAYTAINVPNIFLPRNPGLGRFENDQEKIGLTTSFQWRPSNHTLVTLDGIYSRFEQDRRDFALSNASNNRNVNGATAVFPNFAGRVNSQIQDVHVVPTTNPVGGQVDYMRLDNVDIKHIQEINHSTTTSYMFGLHAEHDFSDSVRGDVRIAQAGSDFEDPFDVLISFDRFDQDGYVWDSRNDVRRPSINYNYDVTNPANVTFVTGGVTPDIRRMTERVLNQLRSYAGNLEVDLNPNMTLRMGGMLKQYDFKSERQQRLFANNATDLTRFNFANFATAAPSLSAVSMNLTGFGEGLELPSGSVTGWVVPDVLKFVSLLGIDCNCANSFGDWTMTNTLAQVRNVAEQDSALYAQINFHVDTPHGMTLRGDVGVRYTETQTDATGYLSATNRLTVSNSYKDWLPSANFALDVTDNVVARFAFARVMSRPGLGNLTPGGTVTNTATPPSATVGNPLLEPYRANNFDLSLEYYPSQGTILSAAWFYKDVENYIQAITADEPFSDTGLPNTLLLGTQTPATVFRVNTSRNTPGGFIQGFELNFQTSFTFLPGLLANTGVQLNYTHTKSALTYVLSPALNAATTKQEFVGVSPDSVNATLFYEDDRFSARVSTAYRDEYLQQVPARADLADTRGSYSTFNVDAAASYNITDHLQIKFDALNLTNQASDQWSGQERRAQRVFSVTGRQFFLGAQYRF